MQYIAFTASHGDLSWLGVFTTEDDAREALDDWIADQQSGEVIGWVQPALYVNDSKLDHSGCKSLADEED